MFKTKEEVIIIQAEAKEPIPTRAVFWSHDKGTAKMLFKLRKDGTSQSLAEGTIVPVVLDFNSDTAKGGIGRHIYHAVIEDAVNGIVSIVLEDNILGYIGLVKGSIYIELPDSRSLDTAGRFTFHIKRSPIDEDVPELEDYYWQGFSDIMEQYHESITEIKSEAKTLLDSLAADVATAKTKVLTLEQSINTANTNLNARIDEINKKIDDNDVFTKAESSANVIDQLIGKENVPLSFLMDFKSKVANSTVENPHDYKVTHATSLTAPTSGAWSSMDQYYFDRIINLDTAVSTQSVSTVDRYRQSLFKWDILSIVLKRLDEKFFNDRGALTQSDRADILRSMIVKMTANFYGFGTGPNGNKVSLGAWNPSKNSYDSIDSHDQNSIQKISLNLTSDHLMSDGQVNIIAFSAASDGLTASTTSTDYVSLEVSLDISANSHIKSMIAQNHVTNLATQTEATNATDNAKTMTPLRTKQLLDSKLLNMVYPIGSIYMSVNSATPATLFGGTWERFSKGRVLVGVDESDTVLATSGKQGGSTNPLTTHTHVTQLTTYRVTSAGSGTVNNLARSTDQGNAATGEFGATSSAGDNTDHNNWPPFTTVYIWKRTA